MTEWFEYRLDDVLVPVDERAGEQDIELVLSVTEKRGIIPQTEVFNKRIATTDVTKYKVMRPFDIAYNPYLLWTGAVGQWLGGEPGVTSPVYECFRVKPPHEPRFMGLLMESGLLTAYFDSTAVGSIQRRRRTTVPVFLAADATLPDPDTQRRIVDLIVAMDAQIEALDAEIASSKILLGCLLNEPWQESKSRISVGAMADLASGPSWAATDESPTPTATGVPVVKITNTRPDGRLDLSERIYVKGLPPRTRVLDDRSLIAIRTNGNRERIGNVYRPSEAVMGSAVSAFQFIVQCQTTDDRDYLYWLLRAPTCQRLMSDAASGSTGLGNLGARWLRALEIPWSEKPERRELLARVTAVAEVLDALTAEGESLSALRRTLLMALLSGEVEIRASNPRLVEAL